MTATTASYAPFEVLARDQQQLVLVRSAGARGGGMRAVLYVCFAIAWLCPVALVWLAFIQSKPWKLFACLGLVAVTVYGLWWTTRMAARVASASRVVRFTAGPGGLLIERVGTFGRSRFEHVSLGAIKALNCRLVVANNLGTLRAWVQIDAATAGRGVTLITLDVPGTDATGALNAARELGGRLGVPVDESSIVTDFST